MSDETRLLYQEIFAILSKGYCPYCEGLLGVAPGREVDPHWCDPCKSYWHIHVGHVYVDSHLGPPIQHHAQRFWPDGTMTSEQCDFKPHLDPVHEWYGGMVLDIEAAREVRERRYPNGIFSE